MSKAPPSPDTEGSGRIDSPGARARKSSKAKSPKPPKTKSPVEEYDVVETISRSGEGIVHEARQVSTDKRVALKLLPEGDAKTIQRFRGDIAGLKMLAHPNVVPVIESGEMPDGQRYVVMEFIDGITLAERLEDGRPAPEEALKILGEICAGVEAMHATSLLHRCLKPSGVIIAKDGRVKIAGFASGASTVEARDYASPEVLIGMEADVRSDIYSLGIIGYEMLTGRTPQGAWTPPSLTNPELDPGLDTVLLTAMQSAPSRRFQTVTEMRAAIAKCGAAFLERGAREVAAVRNVRRRTRAALAFGAIAVLASGITILAWRKSEDATTARSAAEQRRGEAEADASLAIRRADRERTVRGESERVMGLLADEVRARAVEAGRADLPNELLAQAVAYFDKVPTADLDDATFVRKLTIMLVRARALEAAGKLDEAIALAREHLKLADDLAVKLRDDRDRQLDAVESRNFLAGCLFKKGANEEALALANEARDRMARLREKLEKKPSSEAIYVRTCRQLGGILAALNKPDDAAVALGEALTIWQPIADASPTHPHRQAEYSEILRQLGDFAVTRRDDTTALDFFNRAIESDRRVLKPAVWDATHRLRFAENLSAAAEAHARLGDEDKSAVFVQQALPLLEQIEARNPVALPLALKQSVFSHAADIARVEGRLSEAVDYQRRAYDAEKLLRPQKGSTADASGVELLRPEDPPPPIAAPPTAEDVAPLAEPTLQPAK